MDVAASSSSSESKAKSFGEISNLPCDSAKEPGWRKVVRGTEKQKKTLFQSIKWVFC